MRVVRFLLLLLCSSMSISGSISAALAQTSPAVSNAPATGPQEVPVPRYVGPTAGQWERWDFNAHLNGRAAITPNLGPGTTSAGGLNSAGRFSTACIPNPAAPTVAQYGATGATTLSYFIVCHDSNGGATAASPATTIINANATLSASNYVLISWPAASGCSSWDVLKGNTTVALATGLTGLFVNDTGQATSSYAPPARNTTCDVAASPIAGVSPQVTGFTVNGQSNLAAQYGAAGSIAAATASTTSGSASITVNAAGDFAVGNTVVVRHGGAASSLTTPTGLTVTPITYDADHRPLNSGCTTDASNANCTASWTLRVVGTDGKGGATAPSSAVTITNGPANPGVSNPIDIQWANQTAAKGWRIYGCSGASCTPALIATIPNLWFASNWGGNGTLPMPPCNGCSSPANAEYWYQGHNFGSDNVDGTTIPSGAENDDLYASITAINGTNFTLSVAAQNSGSLLMLHDNSPELQALIGSSSDIYLPPPKSNSCWPIAQTISMYKTAATRLHGIGGAGGNVTADQFCWVGGAGDPVFNMNQTRDNLMENFGVEQDIAGLTSTPGVIFDIDRYDGGGGITLTTTHNVFRDLKLGRSGVPLSLSNRGNANDEDSLFEDLYFAPGGLTTDGHWACVYIAGGNQTLNETFIRDALAMCDIGFFLNAAGGMTSIAGDYAALGTIYWVGTYLNQGITDIGSNAQGNGRLLYAPRVSNYYQPISIQGMQYEPLDPAAGAPLTTLPGDLAFAIDEEAFGLRLAGNQFFRFHPNGVANCTAAMKLVAGVGASGQPAEIFSNENTYSDPNWYVPSSIESATNGLYSLLDHTFNGSCTYLTTGFLNACGGSVTLSSGTGTFSNPCITASSHCTANDQTAANAVKVAAPSAGSVAIAGTGSDVVAVACQ